MDLEVNCPRPHGLLRELPWTSEVTELQDKVQLLCLGPDHYFLCLGPQLAPGHLSHSSPPHPCPSLPLPLTWNTFPFLLDSFCTAQSQRLRPPQAGVQLRLPIEGTQHNLCLGCSLLRASPPTMLLDELESLRALGILWRDSRP